MVRRSDGVSGGTPLKIPAVFRAPHAPEDIGKNRKRKQGKGNEEDKKRRNTSTEPEMEEGRSGSNSSAPLGASSIPTQVRRPSGLPVSKAGTEDKVVEAVPPGRVAMPIP